MKKKTFVLTITIKTEEKINLSKSSKYEIADVVSGELGLQGQFEVKNIKLEEKCAGLETKEI